jgi:hypothetical protein
MSRDKGQGCCIAGVLMMLPSGSTNQHHGDGEQEQGPPAAFGQNLLPGDPFRTLD